MRGETNQVAFWNKPYTCGNCVISSLFWQKMYKNNENCTKYPLKGTLGGSNPRGCDPISFFSYIFKKNAILHISSR